MLQKASREFVIGLSDFEGCQKFTPRPATYNGVKGHIWTKRILQHGAWVHQGQQHVRSAACEVEVTAAFDTEQDHAAAAEYWNQAGS